MLQFREIVVSRGRRKAAAAAAAAVLETGDIGELLLLLILWLLFADDVADEDVAAAAFTSKAVDARCWCVEVIPFVEELLMVVRPANCGGESNKARVAALCC